MVEKNLRKIVNIHLKKPMNRRIASIADDVIKIKGGNIVEIGGGYGASTKPLCIVAEKYNLNVIVVDPFESGWDNMPPSYRYDFSKFMQMCNNFVEKNVLQLIKKSSLDPSVYRDLSDSTPIAFAYVDGLQTEEAVLSDLNMMKDLNVEVIGVDDKNRGGVKEALEIFLKESNYKAIETKPEYREVYLCK